MSLAITTSTAAVSKTAPSAVPIVTTGASGAVSFQAFNWPFAAEQLGLSIQAGNLCSTGGQFQGSVPLQVLAMDSSNPPQLAIATVTVVAS